jgi:hypothetical protein
MTVEGITALEPSRFLARETLVSAAINAVISVGFFLLVFGGIDPVPVWGIGNYAFDFVPQSFAIGLMASLVPGLLCRKAMAAGRIAGVSASPGGPGTIVVRAVVNALLAVVVGAGLCALVLWATGVDAFAHTPAFVLKVVYGAVLGSLVTRLALGRMIS